MNDTLLGFLSRVVLWCRTVLLLVTIYGGFFWLVTYNMTWRSSAVEAWERSDFEKNRPHECVRHEPGCNWRDRQIHDTIKDVFGIE